MKMDPNGNIPPNRISDHGSINLNTYHKNRTVLCTLHGYFLNAFDLHVHVPHHFLSGIGLGTVFTRHGVSSCPDRLRPTMVPTILRGKMTNKQIPTTTI